MAIGVVVEDTVLAIIDTVMSLAVDMLQRERDWLKLTRYHRGG